MKAGDILATQSSGFVSKFIRFWTRGEWSHVAIATCNNKILEAVKSNSNEEYHDVREITLNDFLKDKSKVILLNRPNDLTGNEHAQLMRFSTEVKAKDYTWVHALATTILPLYKFLLMIVFFISIFTISSENLFVYFGVLGVVSVFLFGVYKLMALATRSSFGVETTEKIYSKCSLGRYLVRKRYDMFCSKLVLLADREIDGQLSKALQYEDEVQPTQVVESCKSLGWEVQVITTSSQ
ncbi:hypothetical protein [Vibrio sp. ABG19]|uniref:hypothetical protein n=1 Tax=Vibrio sp. ABG19 TaxID=2817385 RepID=UPI00249F44D9|nr:hypothetical protein [Vibrio sp. ABG19]WGY46860.1 hypothetical protein J0X00_18925 [Vibrio sp. ABG19]